MRLDKKHYRKLHKNERLAPNGNKYKYELTAIHREVLTGKLAELTQNVGPVMGCHGSGSKFYAQLVNRVLLIMPGYRWDGCSGPTWDRPSNMRGGLVHDTLFQMMRENILDRDTFFNPVNEHFRKSLIEDGMSRFGAFYYYWGVNNFYVKQYATPYWK